MTYVVTENCVNCKFQDCVAVCPVDCFYEGENFLVIHPDECIDCGVCEPECPAKAIKPDTEPGLAEWLAINAKYSAIWPNITEIGTVPADAGQWLDKPGKRALLKAGEAAAGPHARKPIYEAGEEPASTVRESCEIEGAIVRFPESDGETIRLEPFGADEADGLEMDGLRIGHETKQP